MSADLLYGFGGFILQSRNGPIDRGAVNQEGQERRLKMAARKRIGELLVEKGWITVEQVDEALQIQTGQSEDERKRLGKILGDLGYVTEQQLEEVVREQG